MDIKERIEAMKAERRKADAAGDLERSAYYSGAIDAFQAVLDGDVEVAR